MIYETTEGQGTLFAPDSWSGRTCPEPSLQTRGKTSQPSSKKRSASQTRKPPIFKCQTQDGQWQDAISMIEEDGQSLGGFTMHSIGVSRNGEKESVCWLTSPALRLRGFCLTLNLSEKPRTENPTLLSQILETETDPKYRLSAKACQGILNRAERRGKELPPELKAALMNQCGMEGSNPKEPTTTDATETEQSACKETESTEQTPQDATDADGVGGELHP